MDIIFNYGTVPDYFFEALILPLHKKGDPTVPGNYRGISLLNAALKLYTSILLRRLTEWVQVNNKLSEYQAGFRAGYSTVDNVFTLANFAQTRLKKGRKMYAFFVDFKAGFDSIDRKSLVFKLCNLGISSKFIKALEKLYEYTNAAIYDGVQISDTFEVEVGVRQGCCLSPLLFSLYIDDITDALVGGVSLSSMRIKAILYADDIVVLAETPNSLQLMINKLETYCMQWNLTVNTSKSKVLVFKNGTGRLARDERWTFGGESLGVVKEFQYLGINLTYNLNMEPHLSKKLEKAKAICSNWSNIFNNHHIAANAKFKVFESTARSIIFMVSRDMKLFNFSYAFLLKKCLNSRFLHQTTRSI